MSYVHTYRYVCLHVRRERERAADDLGQIDLSPCNVQNILKTKRADREVLLMRFFTLILTVDL